MWQMKKNGNIIFADLIWKMCNQYKYDTFLIIVSIKIHVLSQNNFI